MMEPIRLKFLFSNNHIKPAKLDRFSSRINLTVTRIVELEELVKQLTVSKMLCNLDSKSSYRLCAPHLHILIFYRSPFMSVILANKSEIFFRLQNVRLTRFHDNPKRRWKWFDKNWKPIRSAKPTQSNTWLSYSMRNNWNFLKCRFRQEKPWTAIYFGAKKPISNVVQTRTKMLQNVATTQCILAFRGGDWRKVAWVHQKESRRVTWNRKVLLHIMGRTSAKGTFGLQFWQGSCGWFRWFWLQQWIQTIILFFYTDDLKAFELAEIIRLMIEAVLDTGSTCNKFRSERSSTNAENNLSTQQLTLNSSFTRHYFHTRRNSLKQELYWFMVELQPR